MSTSSSYRAVFLSPHLDDAAFSCGGEIARLRREGKVLVLNVFTKYLANARKAQVNLSDDRYQEEQSAAGILGYEYKYLNELDIFFRHPRFESGGNIFLPLEKDQIEYLPKVRKILLDSLEDMTFDHLYLPLGIGWHTDHILTFLALLDSPFRNKILFYEDAPYCFIDNATDFRLKQLSGEKEPCFSFLKHWWEASLSLYQSGMLQTIRPAWQRYFAFPVTTCYLYAMLISQLKSIKSTVMIDKNYIVSDVSPFFEMKIKSIMAHKTQIKELFCSQADIRTSYLKHSASINPNIKHCEKYWRLVK